MTIAIGQHAKATSTAFGSSTTVTTSAVTTAATGSVFAILVNAKSKAVSSVTDSYSNTYTLKESGAGFNTASIYICDGGNGGSGHTATVTMASADSFEFFFVEITGAASPSFDVGGQGGSTSSVTSFTGAAVTTTNANDLIISFAGMFGDAGALTDSGTGFSIFDSSTVSGTATAGYSTAIKSSTGTYQDTYGIASSNFPAYASIALKQASAGGVSVSVPAGSLSLSGQVPTVSVTANRSIAVPLGTLSLSGQVPTVLTPQSVAVPAGTLTLTSLVPTVQTTTNQLVSIPLGSLTLSGPVPTVNVSDNQSISVPLGTLSLTGQIPLVQTSGNQSVAVPAGSLTLTGLAPSVNVGSNVAVAVPAGSLSLIAQTPTVAVSDNQAVSVPLGQLILNGLAPTIGLTQNINIDVPAAQLTLTGYSPHIGGDVIQNQPGPLDGPLVSEGAFRRKRKTKRTKSEPALIEPTVFIPPASIERVPNSETAIVIAQKIDSVSLAEASSIDLEIKELLQHEAERDDQVALLWILKALYS